MNTIFKRITSESPSFFKKIQALGITLGAIGGIIMGIPEVAPTVVMPALIYKLAGYFVVAGLIAAGVAKTTVSDPAVLEKKEEGK